MFRLHFITGASGAGKTTAVRHLQRLRPKAFRFFFFDAIGVPSLAEMERDYGSGHGWQRAKTIEWVGHLRHEVLSQSPALLDGQMGLSFIDEACQKHELADYGVVLLDCSDEERTRRLAARGQPELASAAMMDWARRLREEAKARGARILDTTGLSEEESAAALLDLLIH